MKQRGSLRAKTEHLCVIDHVICTECTQVFGTKAENQVQKRALNPNLCQLSRLEQFYDLTVGMPDAGKTKLCNTVRQVGGDVEDVREIIAF